MAGNKSKGKGRRPGYVCRLCAKPMPGKAVYCKKCRKGRPAAVKALGVTLTKSLGRQVKPLRAMPVMKAAKPFCPNPACRRQAVSATANCCPWCSWAYTAGRAVAAQKSAEAFQAGFSHTPEWWEAQAAGQWDPAAREACRAEAQKARRARGSEDAYTGAQLMKASGARSLEEAYRLQTDPRAQQIIHQLLYGR